MKKYLSLSILLLSQIAWSQSGTSIVKFANPESVSTPKGYSHSATIDLGTCNMVIISGQVALDSSGNLVGTGDFKQQTRQVFMNIKNILEQAGGSMNDIVKINTYLTDIAALQIFRDIRDQFVNVKSPPVSTLVVVKSLFRNDLLVEIEATAIVAKR